MEARITEGPGQSVAAFVIGHEEDGSELVLRMDIDRHRPGPLTARMALQREKEFGPDYIRQRSVELVEGPWEMGLPVRD